MQRQWIQTLLSAVIIIGAIISAQQLEEQIDVYDEELPPVCVCVPFYACKDGTAITDGAGLIERRVKDDRNCSKDWEICCQLPSEEETGNQIRLKPRMTGCGYRNERNTTGKAIESPENDKAQFGEFPWMIGIVEVINGLLFYTCGGSLIHPQVVLTAAHCVMGKDPNKLRARAGEWNSNLTNEVIPHQQNKVKSVVIHEEYYSAALYNDIALILLEEPFKLNEIVDIACLPQSTDDISQSPDCLASGWGKKFNRANEPYQTILKKVGLPMVLNDDCQNRLRQTKLTKYFRLHKSFICAGGILGHDTCKGDGGSPLVCPVPGQLGRYYQTGIVSWGIDCGTVNPGVYVNVALFKDWIDSFMKSFNLPTQYNYQ